MKLLLDQNLSFKLVARLDPFFPGSGHVRDFGLAASDDEAVWSFARSHGFAILTKDNDFFHRSLVRGHPPKVIQLRIGNCATREILDLLFRERDVIEAFLASDEESLLVME